MKDFPILEAAVKGFFKENPTANYNTLCSIVRWAKDGQLRYLTPYNLIRRAAPYAAQAGYLTELEPESVRNPYDDILLSQLNRETCPLWRDFITDALECTYDLAKESVAESWVYWRGSYQVPRKA